MEREEMRDQDRGDVHRVGRARRLLFAGGCFRTAGAGEEGWRR